MGSLRTLIRRNPAVAAILLAAALLLRVLIPVGFMPTTAAGQITISLCAGAGDRQIVTSIPLAEEHDSGHHVAAGGCAFADLAMPLLGGIDPVLLTAALIFAFALALAPRSLLLSSDRVRLRPPLRGPPATA